MAIPPTSYFSQFEKSPSPIKPTLVTEKTEEEIKDEETIPVTTTTEVVEKPSEENYFSQFETSEQSTEQSDYFSQFKTTPVKSETVKPKQSDYFLQFDNTGQSTHPSDSNTWFDYHGNTPNTTPQRSTNLYDDSDNFEFDNGRIFGAEPRHMNQNGSFYIDYLKGRIHFSSNITGKTVTLKYISDGVAYLQSGVETGDPWANELNTIQDFIVHKFAQEALIKHVLYACMQSKTPTDHNMVALFELHN